ncbi:LuxR C-terminal-related transcriptional regulator [Streptomyces sp. NPDC015220]|uniref:LuxR C-terminal-related transcriptional regulator n=1 Tax=Streptomyces sp. NPDC015220 TaxID=3364947 RepID=UPI0036F5E5E5
MCKEQLLDLPGAAPLSGALKHRLQSARQAFIAVADDEETWFDTIRQSLCGNASAAGTPPRVLVLCDRIPRRAASSCQAPPPSSMQICVVDEVPAQFAVFDREVAFSLVGSVPVEATDAAAVESLAKCFESLWRRGRLLTGAPDPGIGASAWSDDVQLAIMRRLVNGDTEDKIGRCLGMSRRTVAAHVARISRRLGSTSRTQLGYLIAKGNLLDPFDLAD